MPRLNGRITVGCGPCADAIAPKRLSEVYAFLSSHKACDDGSGYGPGVRIYSQTGEDCETVTTQREARNIVMAYTERRETR